MYAIRTRVGDVYMRYKSNYGDMSALEVCMTIDTVDRHCVANYEWF